MDSVITQIVESIEWEKGGSAQRVLQEALQQVALAGMYRGGFFSRAAFYGGTCLRLFHGLDRYSEDLDFSLFEADNTFDLSDYFDMIRTEFAAYGIEVELKKKNKTVKSGIDSAFLKTDTALYNLSPVINDNIKIKIEVDTSPPPGFSIEPKLLLLPFSFHTPCFVLQDLFSGKMHALLYRKWKARTKGRDWYDFEWYIRKGVPLGMTHFNSRMRQFEETETDYSEADLRAALQNRIDSLDIKQAREEVAPFVRDPATLDIWSREYFLELASRLKTK